ncbi:uncharacterized protein L201_006891 [Kwoniella dendrophila CBS 6074]|uniref:Mediator of RNA polymerase II transcription subunit 13 n=1 Tax=Kwoniella dendrophila CBS 6074 TaxID=1295534 RepID=A0AAX4K440_9TREE
MTDFFGGKPPRPTTVIPGQWIIEIPDPQTQIYIHKYRKGQNLNEAGPSTSTHGHSILDPYEKIWRKFNHNSNEDISISNSLDQPCLIISCDRNEKVLWYFTTNNDEDIQLDDFEEITLRPQPLNISQLITCSQHGHQSTCLSSTTQIDCHITLDNSQDVAGYLELLASALVEKVVWRRGSRIMMHSAVTSHSPINATLRPISSQKLLLSIRPISLPSSSSLTSDTNPPLVLSPFGLPAIHISPSFPTPTQENHLLSTFNSALGHNWKQGYSEAKTRSQISGQPYHDWSIYWIPILDSFGGNGNNAKGKSTPRQVTEKWQTSHQGILTIWPTHLSQSYFSNIPQRHRKPMVRSSTQPKSSDLLGLSTGLFDFFSTYKEPELELPDEDLDEDDEDVNMDMDNDSTAIPETESNTITNSIANEDNDDHEDGRGSDKSDLDDLFSEHSKSPTPVPIPTILSDQIMNIPNIVDDTPIEPISIEETTENTIPDIGNRPLSRNTTNGTANGLENGQKEEMVTEDDFAFFDSPTDELLNGGDMDGLAELGAISGIQPSSTIDQMEIVVDFKTPIPPTELSEPDLPVVEKSSVQTTEGTGIVPNDPIPIPVSVNEAPEPINIDPVASPKAPSGLQPVLVKLSAHLPSPPLIPTVMPSNWHTTDLIPSSFSPIALSLPLPESSFPYSLPTPAPTPSSLNWDLVERIQKQSCKKSTTSTNATYANDWKMDGDQLSDLDDDEDEGYTGPPTPISDYTSDGEDEIQDEFKTNPKNKQKSDETEIEFDDIKCLGAEWLYLIYEFDKIKQLAKDWNPSWIKIPPILPPTPKEEVINNWDKGIDLVRLVKELIGNKSLRDLYAYSTGRDTMACSSGKLVSSSLADEGIMLSELDKETNTRYLPQPQISAGYHNYTIDLSISSLQYWIELGLQPHGGYKDVEAVLLCQDTNESKENGRDILYEMKRTWRDLHLGQHDIAENNSGATDGILVVSDSSFPEAIANVMNQSQSDHLVIYVLLPPSTSISSTIIRDLFNISLSPTTSTVIHFLPPSILNSTDYRDIAFEVYNKIPQPIKQIAARGIPDRFTLQSSSLSEEKHITRQAFNLARTEIPIPEFSMSWPLKSYDLLNNNRFIHSCYTINLELDMMIIFIIDDSGELFDINIWKNIGKLKWDNKIDKLMKYVKSKSDEWSISSRLSLIRVGIMFEDEMKAWYKYLHDTSLMSFTLSMIDHDPSSSFKLMNSDLLDIPKPRGFSNIPITTLNDPSSQIIDLSLSSQLTILKEVKLPIDLVSKSTSNNLNNSTETIYPKSSFILTSSMLDGNHQSTIYNIIHHNHTHTNKKEIKEIEVELGEEIYRINCLIYTRWNIFNGFKGLMGVTIDGLQGISKKE